MSTKLIIANKTNRQAIAEWEDFLDSIRNSTPIDVNETEQQKAERIKYLEKPGHEEEWFNYYFPKFCFCNAADFQIKSTRKFLRASRLYQRRAWARGLAKSTRRMFEIMYKKFVHKMRLNLLLISKNEANAIRLLSTYRAILEANQRLINDYGVQEKPGKWKEEEFITKDGSSFRAVGMKQNPRGAKLDELRVNVLLFDDADDDEVVRNPERLDEWWEWVETAAIPTVEMSKDYFICFDNNIIGEDSIAVRAAKYADDVETISWRNADGKSSWPEKNSESDIEYMETHMSYEAVQKEGYNNPLSQGKTFKEIVWGKCPNLKDLKFVVTYADPATSNKDKPSVKSKALNSCKVVVTIGYQNLKFYIYKCFIDHTGNSNFIDWLYAADDYVAKKTQPYSYIENNTLQDPFYQQVLLPLIFAKAKERKVKEGKEDVLMVSPDEREKPEKWTRIEGNLEPLFRLGLIVFNEEEKSNPNMQRLSTQFLTAKPTSRDLGGPDAVEGGVHIIKNKIAVEGAGGIQVMKRKPNNKRY